MVLELTALGVAFMGDIFLPVFEITIFILTCIKTAHVCRTLTRQHTRVRRSIACTLLLNGNVLNSSNRFAYNTDL
jgi:hypothetical protein